MDRVVAGGAGGLRIAVFGPFVILTVTSDGELGICF